MPENISDDRFKGFGDSGDLIVTLFPLNFIDLKHSGTTEPARDHNHAFTRHAWYHLYAKRIVMYFPIAFIILPILCHLYAKRSHVLRRILRSSWRYVRPILC